MKQTIKNYLQVVRAPAVFTALSNILAANLIITQGDIYWPDLILLMLSSASLYSAGMALNDWFDYEVDCLQRPDRPLPSGRISRPRLLIFSILLLVCGVSFSAMVSPLSLYLSLGIVALILLYDGLLKRTAAAGIVMGGCRYLNWLLGFSVLPLTGQYLLIPVPVFIYIFSLTLLSQQEETAQNKNVVLFTMSGILLSGLSLYGNAALTGTGAVFGPVLILVGISWLYLTLWTCYRDFTAINIQNSMKFLLLAIIPLDALIVLHFASWWYAIPVLLLLLPGKQLARFMYIT